tara:strand:- start:27 stop:479 length:453 start_codon:yes stop_codon:yes gene_type:complete
MKQRGINRVVVAVWDFEAGKTFFEELLGAEFSPENDDGEAAAFGVRVAMAWDAGIELVSPLPGVQSRIREDMEEAGEGVKGIVFAVNNADDAMESGRNLGMKHHYFLDYSPEQINDKCEGRFDTYKEYFISAEGPLNSTVLLGEFVNRKE